MTSDNSAKYPAAKQGMVPERTFTLNPGATKSVGLGVFTGEALPVYEVIAKPLLDEFLGIAREAPPLGNNRFLLLYQFHNFGSKPYIVTVRRAKEADAYGN
ncbi:hypothetical protein ACIRU8_15000 [Streptomyces sp. NPDC101175]|uniref:hypothetical protein n=1 Tax=Streptomyces sp. NPDC101175 TaxID=3366123 RepID=UPI003834AEC2